MTMLVILHTPEIIIHVGYHHVARICLHLFTPAYKLQNLAKTPDNIGGPFQDAPMSVIVTFIIVELIR
jgi:hypothetical protein